MQTVTMYLRATSVKATLVDEWNQTVSVLPALTRGLRAELVLKLLDENGSGSGRSGSTTRRGTSRWRTTGTRRPRRNSA